MAPTLAKSARYLGTWPWVAAILLVLGFVLRSYVTLLAPTRNSLNIRLTQLSNLGLPGGSHTRAGIADRFGLRGSDFLSPPVSPIIEEMVTQALEEYSLNPVSVPYNASGLRPGDGQSCRDVQIISGKLYYEHRGGKFPWDFMHFCFNMRLELISEVMENIKDGGDVEFLMCQEVGSTARARTA